MRLRRPRKAPMFVSLAFILAIIVLVGNSAIVYRNNQKAFLLDVGVEHTREVIDHLHNLGNQMLSAESAQRGYLLTRRAIYLEPYTTNRTLARRSSDEINTELIDEQHRHDDALALTKLVSEKFDEMDEAIALSQRGAPDATLEFFNSDLGVFQMRAMRVLMDAMVASEELQLSTRRADAAASLKAANVSILLSTIIIMLALAGFYRSIQRYIKKVEGSELRLSEANETLEERVRQRTEQVSELNGHLLTVREEEKKNLARELHDELGAHLSAIHFDLTMAYEEWGPEHPELARKLGRALESVHETVEIKRRIMANLRPVVLDDLGLEVALSSYIEDFTLRHEIDVRLEVSGAIDFLEGERPIAIYRIVQESLTNIVRHADATHVLVVLTRTGDRITIEIRDDGIGIPEGRRGRRGSFGLSGMRERALALGGKFSVHAARPHGTIVRVVFPAASPENRITPHESMALA